MTHSSQPRESWGSKIGFIFAVAGSAIGLANIWRFPFLVGQHGGAAFILVYMMSLALIGFPVLIAEILIGRSTQLSPTGAFKKIGKNSFWKSLGGMTVVTGLLVSAFYSAIAGWIIGYFVEALKGELTQFTTIQQAADHYTKLAGDPWFTLGYHTIFIGIAGSILLLGVRNGIERANKWMLPLLFIILIGLAIYGLTLSEAGKAMTFLWSPHLTALAPTAVLAALGQSFFTLSLGQGTMVTYGSYLKKKDPIISSCVPIVAMDTCVSILAAMVVFTIVFSAGFEPGVGPSLIFHTFPYVFSQVWGGWFLAPLFFLLVSMAAITSEISALEPSIAFCREKFNWTRRRATCTVVAVSFMIGIPSALSFNYLSGWLFSGMTFLDTMDFLTNSILIPLGGLAAVILVGWRWGTKAAILELEEKAGEYPRWLIMYLKISFRFVAPLLILLIFAHSFFSNG